MPKREEEEEEHYCWMGSQNWLTVANDKNGCLQRKTNLKHALFIYR
jgi:hypothetical protein